MRGEPLKVRGKVTDDRTHIYPALPQSTKEATAVQDLSIPNLAVNMGTSEACLGTFRPSE